MNCVRESARSAIAFSMHSTVDGLWSSCMQSQRISVWSKMILRLPGDDCRIISRGGKPYESEETI